MLYKHSVLVGISTFHPRSSQTSGGYSEIDDDDDDDVDDGLSWALLGKIVGRDVVVIKVQDIDVALGSLCPTWSRTINPNLMNKHVGPVT